MDAYHLRRSEPAPNPRPEPSNGERPVDLGWILTLTDEVDYVLPGYGAQHLSVGTGDEDRTSSHLLQLLCNAHSGLRRVYQGELVPDVHVGRARLVREDYPCLWNQMHSPVSYGT